MVDDYVIRILSIIVPVIAVVLADGRFTRSKVEDLSNRTQRVEDKLTEHLADPDAHAERRARRW